MLRLPHLGLQGLPKPEAGPRTSPVHTKNLALVKNNSSPWIGEEQSHGALLWSRHSGLAEHRG